MRFYNQKLQRITVADRLGHSHGNQVGGYCHRKGTMVA